MARDFAFFLLHNKWETRLRQNPNEHTFSHCNTTNGNKYCTYESIPTISSYSTFADAASQQWLACCTTRVSWRRTKLQPMENEWMRSTVILDHPGPDWGKSQPCLCASPILFSHPDTLMPVMHGKQSGPADIILAWSCVNNSAWLRGGLWQQSHILNVRDTVLALTNPQFFGQRSSAAKSYWNLLYP